LKNKQKEKRGKKKEKRANFPERNKERAKNEEGAEMELFLLYSHTLNTQISQYHSQD